MTNKPRVVLCIGITANLAARMTQHKAGTGSAFCRRYNLNPYWLDPGAGQVAIR